MPPYKIFLTGASGYIGGSILSLLLKYPNRYSVSALVRTQVQADTLTKLGVTPVLGNLDDADLLTKCAKESDAVLNVADCDHFEAVKALVAGLETKNDKKRAVFLHTSAACFSPSAAIQVPFDDEDMDRVRGIPLHSPHKEIDMWIFENSAKITSAIIAPSTINGIGSGPFRKTTHQIPHLTRGALARGKAGWVGARKNVIWGNVNINDLVELYHLVLDGLLEGRIDEGKKGGWYFGTTHEHTWVGIAEALGKTLHKFGLVKTPEVSQFEEEYLEKYLCGDYGKVLWEGDCRCLANRGKKIGWNPTHPDVFATMEQEIKYMRDNGEI